MQSNLNTNQTVKRYKTGFYKGEVGEDMQEKGFGFTLNDDESIHLGLYKNGQPDGYGISFSADGQITYEGDWSDGKKHGKGHWQQIRRLPVTGYQGRFKHNRRHGKGSLIYPNGYIITGEFQNDLPIGTHRVSYRNKTNELWQFGTINFAFENGVSYIESYKLISKTVADYFFKSQTIKDTYYKFANLSNNGESSAVDIKLSNYISSLQAINRHNVKIELQKPLDLNPLEDNSLRIVILSFTSHQSLAIIRGKDMYILDGVPPSEREAKQLQENGFRVNSSLANTKHVREIEVSRGDCVIFAAGACYRMINILNKLPKDKLDNILKDENAFHKFMVEEVSKKFTKEEAFNEYKWYSHAILELKGADITKTAEDNKISINIGNCAHDLFSVKHKIDPNELKNMSSTEAKPTKKVASNRIINYINAQGI